MPKKITSTESNAESCSKPSGAIDWIECCVCKLWTHINCINMSLNEAKQIEWYKCYKCLDIKSITPSTTGSKEISPDNFISTSVKKPRILKRVPKDSRIPLGSILIEKIDAICTEPVNHNLAR